MLKIAICGIFQRCSSRLRKTTNYPSLDMKEIAGVAEEHSMHPPQTHPGKVLDIKIDPAIKL